MKSTSKQLIIFYISGEIKIRLFIFLNYFISSRLSECGRYRVENMGKQQNIGLIQQILTSLRTRTACRRQRLRQRQGKERPHPRTQLLAHCVRQAMPDLFALSVPAMKASGVRVEFGYTSNK